MATKTKYLNQKQFDKLIKKATETFPNPNVFNIDNTRYELACEYFKEVMLKEDNIWYVGYEGDFIMYTFTSGFCPTDLVADVVSGKYVPTKRTGYIRSKNTGTMSFVIEANKADYIDNILTKNNFYRN